MKKINLGNILEFTKDMSNRKAIFKENIWDVGLLLYTPGQITPDHKHSNIDEVFYVVSGTGSITIDGRLFELVPEDIVFSPCNERHGFENNSSDNLVVLQIKIAV